MNNNDNVEEVPLDLFNQVSLNDYEPVEVVDLPKPPSNDGAQVAIKIPANAYKASLAKEQSVYANSQTPQN